MNLLRRLFLLHTAGHTTLLALLGTGLLRPGRVLAAPWNSPAFEAKTLAEALRLIGGDAAAPSTDLELRAPEIAENGAVVAVDVVSKLPGTRRISLLVDKNPQPLIFQIEFSPGVRPQVSTRIKMAQTSLLRA